MPQGQSSESKRLSVSNSCPLVAQHSNLRLNGSRAGRVLTSFCVRTSMFATDDTCLRDPRGGINCCTRGEGHHLDGSNRFHCPDDPRKYGTRAAQLT